MILTLLILYVVPALIVLYYDIRELIWLKKRHMSISSNFKSMPYRVLIPIFNLLLAFFFVAYDIKLFIEKREKAK